MCLRRWRLAIFLIVHVHDQSRVRSHVQGRWKADWGIDLLGRRFVDCFMFETLPTSALH